MIQRQQRKYFDIGQQRLASLIIAVRPGKRHWEQIRVGFWQTVDTASDLHSYLLSLVKQDCVDSMPEICEVNCSSFFRTTAQSQEWSIDISPVHLSANYAY